VIIAESGSFNAAEALAQIGLASACGSGMTCTSIHRAGAASKTMKNGGNSRLKRSRVADGNAIAMMTSSTANAADNAPTVTSSSRIAMSGAAAISSRITGVTTECHFWPDRPTDVRLMSMGRAGPLRIK
jgi:hypothetical protein